MTMNFYFDSKEIQCEDCENYFNENDLNEDNLCEECYNERKINYAESRYDLD